MAFATFVPKFSYANFKLLPIPTKGVIVPASLPSAPWPTFVSLAEMERLGPRALSTNPLAKSAVGSYLGLTVSDFKVRFADPATQWTSANDGTNTWYQFQGGDIYLEAVITVYLREECDKGKKLASYFGETLSHELLHVKDAVDILSEFLPAELPKDDTLRGYLLGDGTNKPKPVLKKTYDYFFANTTAGADGVPGTQFEQYVLADWTDENNRRAELRDKAKK